MEFAGYLLRFNTSHVTLYPEPEKLKIIEDFSFNTSHVTLYPLSSLIIKRKSKSFNTSHVTLYLCDKMLIRPVFVFQYISCYSLSLFVDSNKIFNRCFNTSHVTLYRIRQYYPQGKYIVSIHLMLLFIIWKQS